jgi:hypothetical protein
MVASSLLSFYKRLLVAMMKGSDDEQCGSDGDEQGEADERVEQREAWACWVFVGIRSVRRWRLRVGLRWKSIGVRHGIAPWKAERLAWARSLVFEGFDGVKLGGARGGDGAEDDADSDGRGESDDD